MRISLSPFHEKYLLTEIHQKLTHGTSSSSSGASSPSKHTSSISNLTLGLLSGQLSLSQQPPSRIIRRPALNHFSWFSWVPLKFTAVCRHHWDGMSRSWACPTWMKGAQVHFFCASKGDATFFYKLKIRSHSILSADGEHFLARRHV